MLSPVALLPVVLEVLNVPGVLRVLVLTVQRVLAC
jgi:hypothetical protein